MRKRLAVLLALCLLVTTLAGYALWSGVKWPGKPSGSPRTNNDLKVDDSHASSGYLQVSAKKSDKRYKLRIIRGNTTMTYDLPKDGTWEVYPLQMGSGTYKVALFRNVTGKKYAAAGEISIKVSLDREDAAFLTPSLYCNYNKDTKAVALSDKICSGVSGATAKYEAIREYIKKNYLYDYIRMATIEKGALPDIDLVTKTGMGICQDLAACAACMLRVQGIPCKVVIGYVGKNYHAWCEVMLDGKSILYDPTADVMGDTKKRKYSVERYY